MATLIPPERIEYLRKSGICSPAVAWLLEPGRTYEDLAEKPHWALIAARFPGANVAKLGEIVAQHGDENLRRRFATEISGADVAMLLGGL